jgi:lipoate-protein ligase A
MAVDGALLESAVDRGVATLRLYGWAEPTLSLGHFQPWNDPGLEQTLAALPRVRRLSGGGAIVHHHELTYSCALPPQHELAKSPRRLYRVVHEAVLAALQELGITAALRGEPERHRDGHFLCFLRGDPHDLLVGGSKILGSAQRRRRGAVLQHGAVLLRRSSYAPDIPGLDELCLRAPGAAKLFEPLSAALERVLGDTAVAGELTSAERERIDRSIAQGDWTGE